MALIQPCNDSGGFFFCQQLQDCVVQNLGNVDFTGATGCNQYLMLNQNGIVVPVTEVEGQVANEYTDNGSTPSPPIVHTATHNVVQIPLHNVVFNDYCTPATDGTNMVITADGLYSGLAIVVTSNFEVPPPVTDYTNLHVTVRVNGSGYNATFHTVYGYIGGSPPLPAFSVPLQRIPLSVGDLVSLEVYAWGNPFSIIYGGVQLQGSGVCPC